MTENPIPGLKIALEIIAERQKILGGKLSNFEAISELTNCVIDFMGAGVI